jgi:hypothetical protein
VRTEAREITASVGFPIFDAIMGEAFKTGKPSNPS